MLLWLQMIPCLREQAMWALWTLASRQTYLPHITAGGTTGVVISAMQRHGSCVGVQEQALWCLYWITVNTPANRARVVMLGGREMVKMAAENHSNVESITGFVPIVLDALSDQPRVAESPPKAASQNKLSLFERLRRKASTPA